MERTHAALSGTRPCEQPSYAGPPAKSSLSPHPLSLGSVRPASMHEQSSTFQKSTPTTNLCKQLGEIQNVLGDEAPGYGVSGNQSCSHGNRQRLCTMQVRECGSHGIEEAGTDEGRTTGPSFTDPSFSAKDTARHAMRGQICNQGSPACQVSSSSSTELNRLVHKLPSGKAKLPRAHAGSAQLQCDSPSSCYRPRPAAEEMQTHTQLGRLLCGSPSSTVYTASPSFSLAWGIDDADDHTKTFQDVPTCEQDNGRAKTRLAKRVGAPGTGSAVPRPRDQLRRNEHRPVLLTSLAAQDISQDQREGESVEQQIESLLKRAYVLKHTSGKDIDMRSMAERIEREVTRPEEDNRAIAPQAIIVHPEMGDARSWHEAVGQGQHRSSWMPERFGEAVCQVAASYPQLGQTDAVPENSMNPELTAAGFLLEPGVSSDGGRTPLSGPRECSSQQHPGCQFTRGVLTLDDGDNRDFLDDLLDIFDPDIGVIGEWELPQNQNQESLQDEDGQSDLTALPGAPLEPRQAAVASSSSKAHHTAQQHPSRLGLDMTLPMLHSECLQSAGNAVLCTPQLELFTPQDPTRLGPSGSFFALAGEPAPEPAYSDNVGVLELGMAMEGGAEDSRLEQGPLRRFRQAAGQQTISGEASGSDVLEDCSEAGLDNSHTAANGEKHTINKDKLKQVYHLSINEAAKTLSMGVTVLKKHCRTFKVVRWPFRKLASIDKLIDTIQQENEVNPDKAETATYLLRKLEFCREKIYEDPMYEIPGDIKRLRQANFKNVYKQRHADSSQRQLPECGCDTEEGETSHLEAMDE